MNYNLLDEQWIPVLYRDGRYQRVGIRTALTDAGRIRQIGATNPMDRVAILRFLLALLYWCKGNPPDRQAYREGGGLPPEWFKKLDENRDFFDLLGEGQRFYQYRRPGDKPLSVNYLMHEIPTGTNHWHFRHSTDHADGLCASCCAMGLTRLPMFSTSGGRGKPPGINAKPPVYVIPKGPTLATTLRLSWQPASQLGTPAWQAPDIQLPATGDVPLLTGLTWLPRRVWLDTLATPPARCMACGRVESLVRQSVFAGLGSTRTGEDEPTHQWQDPHVIYSLSKKAEVTSLHSRDALGAADSAVGQWAHTIATIIENSPAVAALPSIIERVALDHDGVHLWVVGFSTVKNDKYLEATEFQLPLAATRPPSQEALRKLAMWQDENSKRLAKKLLPQSEKKRSAKHAEILPLLNGIRADVEQTVSTKAGALIGNDDDAWTQARSLYRPMMTCMAASLAPGSTTSAVRRRHDIAGVMPNLQPKPEKPPKGGQRKGGRT